jgi:N-acetylglucosaminyl-diphospho-decaprenol L-rhamnosyltransferase
MKNADCRVQPDVDVGVIYTHERQFMPRLLGSLRESADGFRQRLILVDNASADGAAQWLADASQAIVLRNSRRLHYAANLNRVLEAASARYVLLLNTDMYFDPAEQCVAKMIRFMDQRPDCGIAGCRLYHADGRHAPSARRFQSPTIIAARRLGLKRLMRRTIDGYLYVDHAIDSAWQCDWLSGCFLMVRRAAIDDTGPFDAAFLKYFEDVDMCLRMARAGWRVMYNGQTYCHHLEQRASKRLFSADARTHLRSYLRWLQKWGFDPQRHLTLAPVHRAA